MSAAQWDHLWINVNLAVMSPDDGAYGAIEHAALAIAGDRIAWVGQQHLLPPGASARELHDGRGAWITPGLIDCHTHLVYAGNRAREFEQRLGGATYEEIATQGGGIQSTVAATRNASSETLLAESTPRLLALMAEGVTTIEIKSGYGLSLEAEAKMLQVARRLGASHPVTIATTLLAAHTVPPEYTGRTDDYVTHVCEVIIPEIARAELADAVDAFCERIAFSAQQTRRVMDAARANGLAVKLHADQLSDLGGGALAAEQRALSADHLEYASAQSIAAMGKSGTVAVLLPGAFYFLRETQLPPMAALRSHAVPIAIATDCNPGSSPCTSLLLMLNMASTLFRMTPAESLSAVTRNAALALGMQQQVGQLVVGMRADLAIWAIGHPSELSYCFGTNPLLESWHAGVKRPH